MDLELSEFHRRVFELSGQAPKPGGPAARSAVRHLERSFALAETMPELAGFSAITAEEEAATAIFHSLQRRGYRGAKRLRRWNHVHKTALHPFLLGMGRLFHTHVSFDDPMFEFNSILTPGRELLRFRYTYDLPGRGPTWIYPYPPLDLRLRVNGESHDFSEQLSQLAKEKSASDIGTYVKRLANRRNETLYASPQGVPHISKIEGFLRYRREAIIVLLMAFLLIDPHPERQTFVQQALDAFLKMLKLLPEDGDDR